MTENKDSSTFNPNNLKMIRKQAGLTQKNVSSELNIGYTTYYSWESGKRSPHFENILKLANFFNCDMSFFYGNDVEPPQTHKGDFTLNLVTPADFDSQKELSKVLLRGRHFIPKITAYDSSTLFAYEVRDRSMVSSAGQSIAPGQIAILQRATNLHPQELNGAVVLLSENNGAAMLREINLDGSNIVIRSWNESFQHPERSVPQKGVIIWGKVITILSEY